MEKCNVQVQEMQVLQCKCRKLIIYNSWLVYYNTMHEIQEYTSGKAGFTHG